MRCDLSYGIGPLQSDGSRIVKRTAGTTMHRYRVECWNDETKRHEPVAQFETESLAIRYVREKTASGGDYRAIDAWDPSADFLISSARIRGM